MSNPVIEQLRQRRSVRAFTGEPVSDVDLAAILSATQQAPTSINGQQTSLVVIRDSDRIAQVAQIAGGQPQVAGADVVVVFVIDFNRTAEAAKLAGTEQVVERSAEGIVTGAVDAGIALATFQAAANALGYGSTPIGGIRRNPADLIALLDLPPRTYPVVAATLGVPDPERLAQVKPRVPLESYAMEETYDAEKVAEGVATYDQVLRAWWDAQGLTQMGTYSQDTAKTYSTVYFPTIAATLRAQGFEFADEA
ncbi:MAG: NADPH-dependent oxidoreductase [Actinobacteria bacterium HGW-Actinobacteria-2]|nr:MAG: NADPH-dependent oxidoreductase [Actinobacteria bacterium HGW-Actinobacteria-2]